MIFKLKNVTQKIFFAVLFLTFLLTLNSSVTVKAADKITEEQAEYDLLEGGTQKFTLQNKDGTVAYVTVTEVTGKSRVSNGTYKIDYEVPLRWKAGFLVKVVSNQITSAYSPYYTLISGQINSSYLVKESGTQVSYYLSYSSISYKAKTGVRASITKNKLNVEKI